MCKELGEKAATRLTVILPDGKVVGDSEESPQNMDNHADRHEEIIEALAGDVGNSLRFSDTHQGDLVLRGRALPAGRQDRRAWCGPRCR